MMSHSVPKEAIAVYNKALKLSNSGDFDTALEEYRKALQLYPSFIEAYNNMGEIYSHLGESEQALSAYNNALKIERNYRVLLNIGVEHFNSEKYTEAISFFKESVSLKSDFLEGNYYTGLAFYNQKDYREAEKYLSAVIEIDPQHLKANYVLSHIYYENKEYGKTLECLDRIKNTADDKSFFNRYYGFCCYYLGRYDEAVTYLTNALKARPEYKKFKKYLEGLTYKKRLKEIGDLDTAIQEMEESIMDKEPDFKDATRLSMLYIFKGENSKAEELLLSVRDKIAS